MGAWGYRARMASMRSRFRCRTTNDPHGIEKNASIRKILTTDYVSAVSGLAIVVSWIAWFALTWGSSAFPNTWYFTMALSLAFLWLIVWRVRLIRSAFEDGRQVNGIVLDVSFYRDRGRVTYSYTLDGERYQVSNALMRSKQTLQLYEGQHVAVMVNRERPQTGFIQELYS